MAVVRWSEIPARLRRLLGAAAEPGRRQQLLAAFVALCAVGLAAWAAVRRVAYASLSRMESTDGAADGAVAERCRWLEDLFALARRHRAHHIEADYESKDIAHMASCNVCPMRRGLAASPHEAVLEMAGVRDGMRVLDLGCGTGGFALHACAAQPGTTFTCVVSSAALAAIVSARAEAAGLAGRIEVLRVDFDEWTPPALAYDRVVMLESIGYSRDRAALLAKARGALAPGGALYVKTPTFKSPDVSWGAAAQLLAVWQYNFSHAGCVAADMAAAGFEGIRCSSYPLIANAFFVNPADAWAFLVYLLVNRMKVRDHLVNVTLDHPLNLTHLLATATATATE